MTWFENLMGFSERSADEVRSKLSIDGTQMTSDVNRRTFDAGSFETPSLADLRFKTKRGSGKNMRISEIVADVRSLHLDESNANAVFQVASQFNCLEMATPTMTPEAGVGIYQNDWTQGPACSICAGAGTIFRNYFVPVNGAIGQSCDNQIDCLSEIEQHFGGDHWKMVNGYCFPTPKGLAHIENHLAKLSEQSVDVLRGKLKVGVQSKTQVTIGEATHLVTQVFCSALPISYSEIEESDWDLFPRLILDATYEATFHLAVQNKIATGCDKLFLTLVGGGVFGNKIEWILGSIERSIGLFAWSNLDVKIVSYGTSTAEVVDFLTRQKCTPSQDAKNV